MTDLQAIREFLESLGNGEGIWDALTSAPNEKGAMEYALQNYIIIHCGIHSGFVFATGFCLRRYLSSRAAGN